MNEDTLQYLDEVAKLVGISADSTDEPQESGMVRTYLEKSLLEAETPKQQEAALQFAFTNPELRKYGDRIVSEFIPQIDAILQNNDHPLRRTETYSKQGIDGAVVIGLLNFMKEIGMNPEENVSHILYGLHKIQEYLSKPAFNTLVTGAVLRLKAGKLPK